MAGEFKFAVEDFSMTCGKPANVRGRMVVDVEAEVVDVVQGILGRIHLKKKGGFFSLKFRH